jgi:hypothetical protein
VAPTDAELGSGTGVGDWTQEIDEPFWSPKRLFFALWEWAYLDAAGVTLGLGYMVRYHRRPWARRQETGQ